MSRKSTMLALLIFLCILLSNYSSSFANLDPTIEAKMAPGADGESIYISTSAKLPEASSEGDSEQGNIVTSRSSPVYRTTGLYRLNPNGADDPRGQVRNSVPCNTQTFEITNLYIVPESGDYSGNADGKIYAVSTIDRATGRVIEKLSFCKPDVMSANYLPVQLPPPPTYDQIWQAVFDQTFVDGSKSSGAFIAPASPGLTGLPSKFWAKFPNGQSLSRIIVLPNNYRVETTAQITNMQVLIKSPKGNMKLISDLKPDANGIIAESSYENPLVKYNFRSAGKYVISTAVIWTATTTYISGPGLIRTAIPLGSVRLEINRDYQVNQTRAVLSQ